MGIANRVKCALASTLSGSGLTDLLLAGLARAPYIRVVNYHGTPPETRASFAAQLQWYQRHFQPVGLRELDQLLVEGVWPYAQPGLIISFDDGLRSNYVVARPLLEEYGFPGWFFVPPAFVTCPPAEQQRYAVEHSILFTEAYPDGRIAMSAEELRALGDRHVVGCHTRTHQRMTVTLSEAEIAREIIDGRAELQALVAPPVDTFCWVGGEETSYSALAAAVIARAGYRYGFMTNNAPVRMTTHPLQLQRTNIEAHWPLSLVKFQLCGAMDALYAGKRTRVNRLTATPVAGETREKITHA